MTRVLENVRAPLRDGRWLAADVYLPDAAGRWPAIVVQSPYGKERLGAALPHASAHSWLDFWDRERQVLVIADWRGRHGSTEAGEGALHDGRDGYDLVEWTAAQPFCDGRVAGWGPSALGRALFRTAAEHPPSLLAGVPVVSHMGHFYEDFHEGGVPLEAQLKAIQSLGFDLVPEVRGEPVAGTPFYEELARECRPEALDVPFLFVTGWYDLGVRRQIWFFDEVRKRGGPKARAHSRLLVGPWHHTAIDQRRQGALSHDGAAGVAARATRAFVERWLAPGAKSFAEGPAVRYWQIGEEEWRTAERWPPPGTKPREWRLAADGLLTETPGDSGRASIVADPEDPVPTVGGANLPLGLTAGPADQRRIEARDDVLVFTSEALPAPVATAGEGRVVVIVSCDRPDADVAVRLTEVAPDGRSILVADSIRRLSLRGGLTEKQLLTPGTVVAATIELPPIAWTFRAGRRIRISLAGSNHPRFERNPHTGADRYDAATAVPATLTFHFGGASPSALFLPVSPSIGIG